PSRRHPACRPPCQNSQSEAGKIISAEARPSDHQFERLAHQIDLPFPKSVMKGEADRSIRGSFGD
ncbi:MAG TPA: hypothetical protein DCX60_08030, partial [Phycisphaerales bacterium]|nr:hypothetical protein [Phycisphaerales bacterium]